MTDARPCVEYETLVAYLYAECDEDERRRFEAHLTDCDACQHDVNALGEVRRHLAAWVSPEQDLGFAIVSPSDRQAEVARAWWWRVPVWAQVAAAVLVLGVAAGIARLDVRYGPDGVALRTGWQSAPAALVETSGPAAGGRASSAPGEPDSRRAPAGADLVLVPGAAGPGTIAAASDEPAPWRTDLAALERQFRQEFSRTMPKTAGLARAAAGGSASNQVELVRRVQALIAESERRQQRELALRMAQVVRDVDSQRRADLTLIQRGFGQIEGTTGVEVEKQRQLLNYLVSVSQRRP